MAEKFNFNPITGELDLTNAGTDAGIGKQTIWIPAAAWNIPLTNGASIRTEEAATDPEDSNEITTIDFVADDDTSIYCPIVFPKSFNPDVDINIKVFGKYRDAYSTVRINVLFSNTGISLNDDYIKSLTNLGYTGNHAPLFAAI